jgi:hypothetical protein
MKTPSLAFSVLTWCALASVPAMAQQTTGVPGSPDATTTIDGRYLPPPPQPFQGDINLNALQPWQQIATAEFQGTLFGTRGTF